MNENAGETPTKVTDSHRSSGSPQNEERLSKLISRIAVSDKLAFKELYGLVSPRLCAVARNILRHNAEAEDALQEAFLRIWRFSGRFDLARGAPMAWMSTIARNAALDIVRSKRSVLDLGALDELEFATQPLDPPDVKLERGLKSIPPEQAKAIRLMYAYGLSHSELAVTLNVPLGTVKSWVKRGTDQLRIYMKDS